jgi:hypothetical protein
MNAAKSVCNSDLLFEQDDAPQTALTDLLVGGDSEASVS